MTSTLRSKNRQTQAMSTESIGLQLETIPLSPADIERARQLQSREIEFVPGDWMEGYELPFQISLEDTDRISRENEAELFRAMNLLKSRADQLRGQLSPQSPSLALMDQVDALLARAQQIRNYLVRMFMNLVPIIAKRLSNSRYTLDELS